MVTFMARECFVDGIAYKKKLPRPSELKRGFPNTSFLVRKMKFRTNFAMIKNLNENVNTVRWDLKLSKFSTSSLQ